MQTHRDGHKHQTERQREIHFCVHEYIHTEKKRHEREAQRDTHTERQWQILLPYTL